MDFILGIVLVFFPGIVASAYYLKIKKVSLVSLEFPVFIVVFSFLIFLANLAFLYLKGYGEQEVFNQGFFSIQFTLKYLFLSLVFSVLLPHVLCILSFAEVFFDRFLSFFARGKEAGKKRK